MHNEKKVGVCVCVCVLTMIPMVGCITGESDEEALANPSSEADLEWQRLIEEEAEGLLEPDDANCHCEQTTLDPDCDYSYFGATAICNLGGTAETADDAAHMWYADIENEDDVEIVVNCSLPLYFYYDIHNSSQIEQVVVYGVNQHPGSYDLECTLRTAEMGSTSYTTLGTADISAQSSSIQMYELDGLDIDLSVPILALYCSIPRMSTYSSSLRGFRVCYNP